MLLEEEYILLADHASLCVRAAVSSGACFICESLSVFLTTGHFAVNSSWRFVANRILSSKIHDCNCFLCACSALCVKSEIGQCSPIAQWCLLLTADHCPNTHIFIPPVYCCQWGSVATFDVVSRSRRQLSKASPHFPQSFLSCTLATGPSFRFKTVRSKTDWRTSQCSQLDSILYWLRCVALSKPSIYSGKNVPSLVIKSCLVTWLYGFKNKGRGAL